MGNPTWWKCDIIVDDNGTMEETRREMNLAERVNKYAEAVTLLRNMEKGIKSHKEYVAMLETELLDEYAIGGLQSIKAASGETVYLRHETHPRLVGELAVVHDAFRREGLGDLIKEGIHHQTLGAWYREVIADDKLPEGLAPYIEVHEEYRLRMRS
jgi:hypothetical protein